MLWVRKVDFHKFHFNVTLNFIYVRINKKINREPQKTKVFSRHKTEKFQSIHPNQLRKSQNCVRT